jgi:quercetin dioxygenase-like cupin family protein
MVVANLAAIVGPAAGGLLIARYGMAHAVLAAALVAAPALPSASANKGDYKWNEMMPGMKAAEVWKDPATGGTATMMQATREQTFPRHFHTSGSHVYVIKGELVVTEAAGKGHKVKAGGYLYEPARMIHTTKIKKGTTAFQIGDGAFDFVPVDDKGDPLPPPPAPASK